MSMDFFILVAFCVFLFLLGMRLRQRFVARRQMKEEEHIHKNQRPKMASEDGSEEPPIVKERRLRREKRVRFFTMAQLVLLFGLMVFMLPNLIRDCMVWRSVEHTNLFLRCLIFVCTIYIFILGYMKVFSRKKRD